MRMLISRKTAQNTFIPVDDRFPFCPLLVLTADRSESTKKTSAQNSASHWRINFYFVRHFSIFVRKYFHFCVNREPWTDNCLSSNNLYAIHMNQ